MCNTLTPIKQTGLTQHDLDQFKSNFVVPLVKEFTPNLQRKRQDAAELLKKKIKRMQVFFQVRDDRQGVEKLYFLGWVVCVDGREVALFQRNHEVITRASLLRDIRDVDNAPLTGYYLTKTEAEKALADFYRRKLDALQGDSCCNHGKGVEHGDHFPVPGAD